MKPDMWKQALGSQAWQRPQCSIWQRLGWPNRFEHRPTSWKQSAEKFHAHEDQWALNNVEIRADVNTGGRICGVESGTSFSG